MAPQPEQQAREKIDQLLAAAGWHVCVAAAANIHAARGVAICEFPLPGHSFADYLLYVDCKATGVIEAKKEGVTLTGVETQSDKYTKGLPAGLPRWSNSLPFAYQTTGVETRCNLADQTLKKFQQYVSPYNNFKFSEEYIVPRLQGNQIDTTTRVCICTIQRMYFTLRARDLPDPTPMVVVGFCRAARIQ